MSLLTEHFDVVLILDVSEQPPAAQATILVVFSCFFMFLFFIKRIRTSKDNNNKGKLKK